MSNTTPGSTNLSALSDIKIGPDFGWAIFRFPGTEDILFTAGKVLEATLDEYISPSFVIAPFHSNSHQYWQIENTVNQVFPQNSWLEELKYLPFYHNADSNSTRSKSDYCKLVENILKAIDDNKLEKAVPARAKHVKLESGFEPFVFYKSLLNAYPNAFVYMISTPSTGTWIGCSPELLLKARDKTVSTLALAGTRKVEGGNLSGSNPLFGSKEFEEQAIVTHYIQAILEKYCDEVVWDGPEIIQAGNVYHLASNFQGILSPESEGKFGNLLKNLHPTPAVCGLPLKSAMAMLLEQENFDRSLYSGFLGPVTENTADLFVNLRCMQLFAGAAQLYAGAGVVKGSDPEKEWLETEEKMNTLLRFF